MGTEGCFVAEDKQNFFAYPEVALRGRRQEKAGERCEARRSSEVRNVQPGAN